MKPRIVYCFLIILLVSLFIISNCYYSITESNNEKEYPALPLFIETGQTNITRNIKDFDAIPVQQAGTITVENKNIPPVADFSIIPDRDLYAGEKINFYVDSSEYPDGEYLEYSWNFGDGSPPFGPTPHNPVCHTYLIKGDYMVSLTVFDNAGDFSVKEMLIHIQNF